MEPKDIIGLKDAYLANCEAILKVWDAEILKLAAKSEQAQVQVKIQYYEWLESLRTKQTTVREKLHELKRTRGAAWESVKIVEKVWYDMKGGLTNAAAKFQ